MKYASEIDVSMEEIFSTFVHSGSDDQAKFFNTIGKAFKESGYDFEMQYIGIVNDLNKDGKDFIYTLANFLKAKGMASSPKMETLLSSYE